MRNSNKIVTCLFKAYFLNPRITLFLCSTLLFDGLFVGSGLSAQPKPTNSAPDGETVVNVFFGTTRALSIAELRTNASAAMKAKGYALAEISKCVVNISVVGKPVGCAVIFWDLKAKVTYQVLFDAQGKVVNVSGGPMDHGSVRPDDPVPEITRRFNKGKAVTQMPQPQSAFSSEWETNGYTFRGTVVRTPQGDHLVIEQFRKK